MEIWCTEEPNEHGFVEDSWVCDRTQDGDVHKNPGRLTNPCLMKGGRGSTNRRAVNQAHVATALPNLTARQARATRATPGNRENIVKRENSKEDDAWQPSRCGSRNRGPARQRPLPARAKTVLKTSRRNRSVPQPIGAQVAQMGQILPKFNLTSTRTTTAAATLAQTTNAAPKSARQAAVGRAMSANRTYADALRQSNPLASTPAMEQDGCGALRL